MTFSLLETMVGTSSEPTRLRDDFLDTQTWKGLPDDEAFKALDDLAESIARKHR